MLDNQLFECGRLDSLASREIQVTVRILESHLVALQGLNPFLT